MKTEPMVGYVVQKHAFATPIGKLFDYFIGGNGVFIRASRPELAACVPISDIEIRGLLNVEPFVNLAVNKVPANYVQMMLDLSRKACIDKGGMIEALFHLIWLDEENRWRLDVPEQQASGAAVRPLDDGHDSSYAHALIEVHSHHEMSPRFSGQDDADEQGFRIYGVIGKIFSEPKLRVRVGVFGHFLEVPAETIFELPETIGDALESGKTEE